MTHWNHRVICTVDDETLELMLQIAEVYYNDKGEPYAYSEPFITGETLGELTETLNRMQAARLQPILVYPGDFSLTDDDTPVAPV